MNMACLNFAGHDRVKVMWNPDLSQFHLVFNRLCRIGQRQRPTCSTSIVTQNLWLIFIGDFILAQKIISLPGISSVKCSIEKISSMSVCGTSPIHSLCCMVRCAYTLHTYSAMPKAPCGIYNGLWKEILSHSKSSIARNFLQEDNAIYEIWVY